MWLPYLSLLIPAIAAVAARPLAARLDPRQATWLLTATAAALAACSMAALALLAAFAAANLPVLAAAGDYSARVMRRGDPVSVVEGAAAVTALTGCVSATITVVFKRARALAASYQRAAQMQTENGIVVVSGPAIEAYALPGQPGRIVISGSLLSRLDERGQAVLIAHEQAHLADKHHLFTSLARLAAAANPLLIPVARAVDFTVERWADEQAAAVTSDRLLVAHTIGRVALLAGGERQRPSPPVLAVTGQLGRRVSLARAGPVPRRVAAMLAAPPRKQIALVTAFAIFVLAAGVAFLLAANNLHALIEVAQGGS